MNKFPFWHRGLDQSFRNEPALGPKGVRRRGKVPRIALDREEVDARRSPFRDITAQGKGVTLVVVSRRKGGWTALNPTYYGPSIFPREESGCRAAL